MLTATFNSYVDRQISTPTKLIPQNRSKKLSTDDYVHETTPYTKFGTLGASGQMGENVKYNKNYFTPFFLRLAYGSDIDGFLRAIAHKT